MNKTLQKRIEEAAKKMSHNKMAFWEDCDYSTKDIEEIIYDACKLTAVHVLQNQWISVEEALPEKNTMCIVRKETEVGIIYDTDYIDYEGKWFFNFNRASIKSMVITHWMPIPQLKGGEK